MARGYLCVCCSFPLESCPSLFLHSPGYSVRSSVRQQEITEAEKA